MPVPTSELEKHQLFKLIQHVYKKNYYEIKHLCENGVYNLINYNEPNEGKTVLIKAIESNDETIVNLLVEIGADAEIADFNGKTPLMYSCELGFYIITEKLCKLKVNLNAQDNYSNRALSYCLLSSTKRHIRCLDILLEHQVDCNYQTNKGSVFVEACEKNLKSAAFSLIRYNIKINTVNPVNGNHALHYTSANGSFNLSYSLLTNQVDPNIINSKLQTPSILAAQNSHINILKLLFSFGANFELFDSNGNNVIHYAVYTKKPSLIKYLASRGANPKIKNSEGFTPRKLARFWKFKGFKKTFKAAELYYEQWKSKFLKQQKIDNNVQLTALNDNREIFNWILRIYDFIHVYSNKLKAILLELANDNGKISKQDFINVFKMNMTNNIPEGVFNTLFTILISDINNSDLIELDSILNCKGFQNLLNVYETDTKKYKNSKLKIHRIKRKTKVKIGIPIKFKDSLNKTTSLELFQKKKFFCIDYLRFNEQNPTENILQDDSRWYINCPSSTFMEFANMVNQGDIEAISYLLHQQNTEKDKLVLLNSRDKYYKTPLMISAAKSDIKTVNYLLENNVDVNLTDNFLWTALHHAVFNGSNMEIVLKLIKHGAVVNARSITGTTPLMLAIESNNQPLVELLAKNDALIFDPVHLNGESVDKILAKFLPDSKLQEFLNDSRQIKIVKQQLQILNSSSFIRKTKNDDKNKNALKIVASKVPRLKLKYSLRKMMGNHMKKLDCASIKLPILQNCVTKQHFQNQFEIKRNIHDWEHDFPNYKSPFQKNIERILEYNHSRPKRKKYRRSKKKKSK